MFRFKGTVNYKSYLGGWSLPITILGETRAEADDKLRAIYNARYNETEKKWSHWLIVESVEEVETPPVHPAPSIFLTLSEGGKAEYSTAEAWPPPVNPDPEAFMPVDTTYTGTNNRIIGRN